jgi:hypothetical protein
VNVGLGEIRMFETLISLRLLKYEPVAQKAIFAGQTGIRVEGFLILKCSKYEEKFELKHRKRLGFHAPDLK